MYVIFQNKLLNDKRYVGKILVYKGTFRAENKQVKQVNDIIVFLESYACIRRSSQNILQNTRFLNFITYCDTC